MAINPATGTTWSAKGGTGSTAELRALGTQVSNAIASAGMVKTTDTGQIDWTTVNWSTGSQTWGYEIWRFNDALHATKPVFLKFSYTQSASVNMLQLVAQTGTATDGAGGLQSAPGTGVSISTATNSAFCVAGSSATTGTTSTYCVYGDGSSLVIAVHPDRMLGQTTSYGGLFFLERVRDVDGSPLGDAVLLYFVPSTGGNSFSQVVLNNNLYAQPSQSSSHGWFPQLSPTFTSGVIGSNMYVAPWFTGFSPRLGAPSTMIIGHYRTDMSTFNTFTCNHYGSSRTFISIAPPSSNYSFGMNATNGVFYPAIRIT